MNVTVGELTWLTVRLAIPPTAPDEAVIVAVPPPTGVASPLELIVATEELEDDQFTELELLVTVPSV